MCASYKNKGVSLHEGEHTYTGVQQCFLNDRTFYEIGMSTKPMV